MSAWPTLSLPEWIVLAVVSEGPTHGFAIAQLTTTGGELGRIWQIPRPVIYRSIGRLLDLGLLTPRSVESGRGPQRTLYSATPQGAAAVAHWLDTPVQHIRGDGRLQTEAELEQEEAGADTGAIQPSLFDTAEVTVWRSIRSVLRKGTPPTSSEP